METWKHLLPISEKSLSYLTLFSTNQCSLIPNSRVFLNGYKFFTDKSLSNITFTDSSIGKIRVFDPNKAHSHDMMCICMLKICGDSFYKPLGLFFRNSLDHGVFPQNWKKKPRLFLFVKK